MTQAEVIVAGGGIIGLATALEMRRRGAGVMVIDDARPGFASRAAAGMLAAHDPENPPVLQPLSNRSLQIYPDLLRRACALADQELPFETSFTLQRTEHHTGTGRMVAPAEVKQLLPALAALPGYKLLLENSLDPRRLHSLLRAAAAAAGVQSLADSLHSAQVDGNGVSATCNSGTVHRAEYFVDCRGAWMQGIAPRKGQLVRVRLHGELTNTAMGNIVVRTPEIYIVPRLDGSAVIGATVEDCGYDVSTDAAATRTLMSLAAQLLPAAGEAEVLESWAGLRPCTPDGLPRIGCVSDRIFVAGGHFRNGILLAPGTAEAICDLISGLPARIDLEHFRPDR